MKYLFTYFLLLFSNSYSLVTPPTPVDHTNICLAAKKIFCASKSPFILNEIHNDVNKFLIKEVTGWLPAADIVSKKVLEWNDIYITRILDLIKIVQWGDNTGSDFINWYFDFVNCLLP
jgi:hypothetical protein